ncbi:hypothetical protein V8G54_016474 [Vigna mungo]|uniref:SWIM-type domain-containing protein n=1 Tax=Vigna mungo TaxID=3915 RepID=A0AAQ3S1D7_VIGMU
MSLTSPFGPLANAISPAPSTSTSAKGFGKLLRFWFNLSFCCCERGGGLKNSELRWCMQWEKIRVRMREVGDFGLLVPMERKLGWEVKEVKNFLLGKKKHLNVLVLGFTAMESSFPRIYEISCISPTPPVVRCGYRCGGRERHWLVKTRWFVRALCQGVKMVFEVCLHHMGRFDRGLRYVDGEVHVVVGLDPDRWSYFEAVGIVKEFKYDGDFKLWWKGSREIMMNNLRLLSDDKEAMNLSKYAEGTGDMVEIYVQHVPSEPVEVLFLSGGEETLDGNMEGVADIIQEGGLNMEQGHPAEEHIDVEIGHEEVQVGEEEVQIVEEEEVQIGEEEVQIGEEEVEVDEEEVVIGRGRIDESEEERMDNDDDGFGVEDDVRRNINPLLERWNSMKRRKKRVTRRGNVGEGSFVIDDEVGEHEINEEYISDELDSDLESDEDGSLKMGKFKKFRQDDMNKDFKLSLGMEFGSLKDFKNALMEHSVLNGKEIKFVKNDLTRVRAECKKKCGFLIMASKVGGKETFRVKTLVGRQRCGRVFGNTSASVNWIAQVLIDRFVNVASMIVNQIIDDIKKSFSVGITAWKAGKAKQIALDSLVGDGDRQYSRLYDYVGALLRVKCGTFKIKVNQPQPSLPPRFGSFYMCLEGCKQGFLGSCRPFIGVDGCHRKTTYGGQLLVAIGRDPNDQYFPLAFAVVENECKETWRWFLSQLLDDIGGTECQRWVFISDQQKGLMTVFDEMMDGVEHRLCLRHLYNNFKKRFGGGVLIRDLMMGATKATYEKEWEKKDGEKAMTYPGVVMPRPRKRLDKEIEKSGNWIPTWAGAEKFEVTHGFTMDKFVVDLSNNSCSCYSWDLIGIPCRHAIAAITYKVQNPEDYVHVCYKKLAYVTCYVPEIVPINGQQMWPNSENTPLLLPPIYKIPPGRPKKLRRREADEPVSHTKLSKKHAIMKCSSCKEFGYNVRSCRRKKNTRGTSSAGGSGSKPISEAEAPPSTSHGAVAGAASRANNGASRDQDGPSFSGAATASRGQAAGRTASGLGAHHLGSQASTT